MGILSTTLDLSTLSDPQLRVLVRAAAEVLGNSAGDNLDPSTMTVGPQGAAQELVPALNLDHASITVEGLQSLLEKPETSRTISLKVLEELRRIPEVAQAIDESFSQRQRALSSETVLLAAGLLVLAVKVKEIDWHGGKVTFYQCAAELKDFLAKLVATIH